MLIISLIGFRKKTHTSIMKIFLSLRRKWSQVKRSLEEQQATNLFRYEHKIQTLCHSKNKLRHSENRLSTKIKMR